MKKLVVEAGVESDSDKEMRRLGMLTPTRVSRMPKPARVKHMPKLKLDRRPGKQRREGDTGCWSRLPKRTKAYKSGGFRNRKTSDVGIAGGPSDQEETGSRVDEEYAVLTLVCVVAQIVQANEMRGMFVATEGAMVYPEATLALGESEWVVIYDVPTKRAEQVMKLEIAWVDDMSRTFEKAITGNFPIEVKPFFVGPALDLAEIKTRAERRR
ncbi:Uncharacterized protein APZ42_026017 [Daphnia magna]|uniref:Uncharacterized protein n=1 Tax=Daphnia magna TaxID=35525 RepID=A0A164SJF1_9CRUS|nr:Uncharacterized protein APZ42_026017 [Daphnia magna]